MNSTLDTVSFSSVVALSGGVGGARLAYGLSRALGEDSLTVIVNTGDDFVHWGLNICPDLDTVMYTLSELSDDDRGWGISGDTFSILEGVRRCGGETWFQLGDRDLATHLSRTEALGRGATLTSVTTRLCSAAGVRSRVLPMSDGPCRTMIETRDHGTLPFQHWLVRHGAPAVRRIWFDGDPAASPEALSALDTADLVIICPSNPYVSIDPILFRPGVRSRLAKRLVVAVSPIVGHAAVKGPLAEMIQELTAAPASASAVARHYGSMLAGLVVEEGDDFESRDVVVCATQTIMRTRADRVRLAHDVLAFSRTLQLRRASG